MRMLLFALLVSVTSVSFSQDREESVKEFTTVKVFDGISATLVKSDENKVIISGANTEDVQVVDKNGVLKLRMDIEKTFSGFRTFAEIHYRGILDVIDVNENSKITTQNPVKQIDIVLRAQEGGEIQAEVAVERLTVKAVTGGIIETTGTAKNQNVQVNTGGNYEGDETHTEQTSVKVNAGGTAYINASHYVDADVRAGGTIRIFGQPKSIDKKTFLGGRIIEQ